MSTHIDICYYFIDFPFSSYLNLKHFLMLLPFVYAYFDMDKFFPTFCCCCCVRKHKLQKQHQHFGFITIIRRQKKGALRKFLWIPWMWEKLHIFSLFLQWVCYLYSHYDGVYALFSSFFRRWYFVSMIIKLFIKIN